MPALLIKAPDTLTALQADVSTKSASYQAAQFDLVSKQSALTKLPADADAAAVTAAKNEVANAQKASEGAFADMQMAMTTLAKAQAAADAQAAVDAAKAQADAAMQEEQAHVHDKTIVGGKFIRAGKLVNAHGFPINDDGVRIKPNGELLTPDEILMERMQLDAENGAATAAHSIR